MGGGGGGGSTSEKFLAVVQASESVLYSRLRVQNTRVFAKWWDVEQFQHNA